ncbi:putative pentatricopeptide repeat-containing protein [Hordeum vulgare]|nr:putative pentatricopeptide repeat-containing protein [Hordeum vulgare]
MHVHMEYCYEQLRKFEMVDSDDDEEIVLREMQCLPKDLACALGSAKRSLLETLEKAESDKKMKTQEEKSVIWGPTLSSRPTTRKHGNINIMDKAKAYRQKKNLEIPKSLKESTLATAPTSPSSIPAWNALLAAHSRGASPHEALRVFRALPPAARPDSTTFTLALSACARLGDLATGEVVTDRASGAGYGNDIFVCSSVLNLYAKCGAMDDAVKVFDRMRKRDRVTWSTMVTGFVNAGQPVQAIEMYMRMRRDGLEADEVVIVGGYAGLCSNRGCPDGGLSSWVLAVRHAMQMDVVISTSLVDMYAKNGLFDQARRVFELMPHRK